MATQFPIRVTISKYIVQETLDRYFDQPELEMPVVIKEGKVISTVELSEAAFDILWSDAAYYASWKDERDRSDYLGNKARCDSYERAMKVLQKAVPEAKSAF